MTDGIFRSGRRQLCRTTGLCLAISMMTAMSVISLSGVQRGVRVLTPDVSAELSSPSGFAADEIAVTAPSIKVYADSEKNEKAYEKLIRDDRGRSKAVRPSDSADETLSTTTTTAATESEPPETTTFLTTTTFQAAPTTLPADREQPEEGTSSVSNGMSPFNYNDVSSVASHLNTLGDFVDAVHPSFLGWNAEEYAETRCVEITLDSDLGSVVLDVRPLNDAAPAEEATGSVSGADIPDWSWLNANRGAGCNISSVVWKDAAFRIEPVRGIGIGDSLAALTDCYLCVNGGANTLYKASDVITDQNKLNAILAAENLYTFVGGRVFSIGSYLDKYYGGRERAFVFEDCDYVVQYGCNSIMEHNYTTGSWIIEYAVKEDKVIGVSFMNKSYYSTAEKTAVSASMSSSGNEFPAATTHAESVSSADCPAEEESGEAPADSGSEEPSTTATEEESAGE